MGLRRNGDAADDLLIGAKQPGIDYAQANDYLDATFETIRQEWDLLATAQGRKPLAPPLFERPPKGCSGFEASPRLAGVATPGSDKHLPRWMQPVGQKL